MDQQAMFQKEIEDAGYRMQYLQLYNWGTFGDGKVWEIRPEGKTSLLTGSNGSGKTTLVDALLTLLIPTRIRFYNQSSGAESKRDRTEASYVQGAFKQKQDEGQLTSSTEYLRSKDDVYSVLLACFYNEGLGRYVTLGQVRWFMSGGKLSQVYFSATKALDILQNEIHYDPGHYWKERLRKKFDLQFYDSFSKYQAYFVRAFGMRSEKALNLFNQTVGIKVLGKLDDFIRQNMLEPGEPESEFSKLWESFQNLLSSYRAFEQARAQLNLLAPIAAEYEKLQAVRAQLDRLNLQRRLLPVWLAEQELDLLETAMSRLREAKALVEETVVKLEAQRTEDRHRESKLMAQIQGNEVGRQIKDLESENKRTEREMSKRKVAFERYEKRARKLDLIATPTQEEFLQNLHNAKASLEETRSLRTQIEENKFEARKALEDLKTRHTDLVEELESLLHRKNRIPRKSIDLRAKMLDAIGATEADIPFIGELLRVKDAESAVWEDAIQRVLHNFALRLVVPHRYYSQVNRFVRSTNLNGRIVYHKVDANEPAAILHQPEPDALYEKLDIQPKTQYFNWVEKELIHRFDHICTADEELFRNCKKALTPEGLSRVAGQHEKDDRRHRLGKENYVMGWDNKEKVQLLRDRLKALDGEIKLQERRISTAERELNTLEKRRDDLNRLLEVRSYEAIDWRELSDKIAVNEKQLETLRKSNNQLKELETQLKAVQQGVRELDKRITQVYSKKVRIETEMERFAAQLSNCRHLLKTNSHLDLPKHIDVLSDWIAKLEGRLVLEKLGNMREKAMGSMTKSIEAEQNAVYQTEKLLQGLLTAYKNPSPEVQEKFRSWTSETREMGSGIASVQDYLAKFQQINDEDILTYEKKFREYLDEKMVGDMANFQTALNNRLEAIENNIDELNQSLRQIDFKSNPRTYIQLVHKPHHKEEIRDFRNRLKSDWKFDAGAYAQTKDIKLLERSFQKMRSIIEGLHADANYRGRVIDVRNWLRFHATEHYAESGEQANVYESTGHLSGGEKAQITYTILGAALAYQFGIDRSGKQDKSFRFIVVDEAFSKLDPEKSRYLMELCRQLHLQLLVVTPLDKIHVVEDYIQACHYVENKNKRHSRVYNLTLEQYRARKSDFRMESDVSEANSTEAEA